MSGLGNGLVQLFKAGRKRIGKAVDNYLLDAEARKAISDEVLNKYKPKIDIASAAENKRAANIKDLDKKLTQSKQDLANAQKAWQDKYANALADAKNQRQLDINDYEAKLQGYQGALDTAEQGKRSIMNQLNQQEATYTPTKTIFTDVNTGDRYLIHPVTGEYKNITQIFKNASQDQQRRIARYIKDFDERLVDNSSGTPKVINAFNKTTFKQYHGNNNIFDTYIDRVGAPKRVDLIDANNQIKQAKSDLSAWENNPNKPSAWDETTPGNNDLTNFETGFRANNGDLPTTYNFNGQTYKDAAALDNAYQQALASEKRMQSLFRGSASRYTSKRDNEIAQRIQDAKDIKKAKLALGAGAGIGALYAGARAIYGGNDTDNTDNTNNIDNTDNTYTGKSDSHFNVEKEGQAILKDRQQSDPDINVDTDFDPDKAAAVLASGAYDTGVEDGNSIKASDIVTADGQAIDDGLFELLKAMKDPHKADAIANYIYSRHGDDLDVQRLGWRGWLNRYGDSLRSKMNIDPSGYNGMHISGGL